MHLFNPRRGPEGPGPGRGAGRPGAAGEAEAEAGRPSRAGLQASRRLETKTTSTCVGRSPCVRGRRAALGPRRCCRIGLYTKCNLPDATMNLYMRLICNKSVCFSNLRASELHWGRAEAEKALGRRGWAVLRPAAFTGRSRGREATLPAPPPGRGGRPGPRQPCSGRSSSPPGVAASGRIYVQAQWPPGVSSRCCGLRV